MASAEVVSASLGPQYAPEDPTLAKPWKGLIDGSTGVLYYWNPESNVTQYERPPNVEPLMAPGIPPPKLAAIPMARAQQHNVMTAQQGQEYSQSYQPLGQQMYQPPQGQYNPPPQYQNAQYGEDSQRPATQMAPGVQPMWQQMPQQSRDQMGQQPGQAMPPYSRNTMLQQPGQTNQQQLRDSILQQGQENQQQSRDQMLQQPAQTMPQQSRDQLVQPPGQRMPQHSEQQPWQHEAHKPSHFQGQQVPSQQQQVPYQAPPNVQAKLMSQPQAQQGSYMKGQQTGYPPREESEFQRGRETGFSPSAIQQPGVPFFQNRPQNGAPSVPSQQHGIDLGHQANIGRPIFQGQPGSSTINDQRPGGPPMGVKMGHLDDFRGRPGSEYNFNPNKGASMMVPQQSKLATVPLPQNQMEMEVHHRVTSDHANGPRSAIAHMQNHAAGGQTFIHNAAGVPPAVLHGSSDAPNLSAVDAYCREHEISATGENVPAPFMTFEATGLPPEILREIQFAGFSSPTPIQAQTWPISLQSRDIVAVAKTGSGKTLGYLVPAFIHLRQCRTSSQIGPKVLVLAPTRELATQIQDEAVKFGRSSGISCTCLYGGAPKGPQIRDLDRGVDIVVATPGRLNDILEMKKIDFRQVSFLVLDEADRMLDMGFEPQIRKIVDEIPPHRQTLMYTATWPKEVRKIAGDLLVNPVQVNIGRVDELAANKAITQIVEVVLQMNKQRRLEQILRSQERGSKVIIFCSTKRMCDQLTRSIGRNFGAAAIHGDKSQGERDHVLNQFRNGKSPILVATDVAARGLDVKDIRMVINYDFPTGVEDYVHRIGRTGRAGATGVAYTFFTDQDRKHAADLIKVLEGANQLVPPEVQEMAACGRPSFVKSQGGMSRGDSGGGRSFVGGRGGMRDDAFAGHGGMRDGSFGGRGGQRDDGFGGHRGRDDFGGGRNDFGGRGNRGRGFSGPGRGPVGFGRHDSGPPDRYNNNGRGQYNSRRGIADGARGRSFGRNHSASPDMVSTWDTRSSSSSGRSRSRSRSPSRSRNRSRSRSRSRSLTRNHIRSRNRSRSFDGFKSSRGRTYAQDTLRSEHADPLEPKISSLPAGTQDSSGPDLPGKLLLTESTGRGGSGEGASLQPVAGVDM